MTMKPPEGEDECSWQAQGHLAVADLGYRTAREDQFLDLRGTDDGTIVPLNATSEEALPGLRDAAASVLRILTTATEAVLRSVAIDLKLPPAILLEPLQSSDQCMPGGCLRMCKYADAQTANKAVGDIAFAQHTDTTMITLAMCSTEPGLEIRNQSGIWITPEI